MAKKSKKIVIYRLKNKKELCRTNSDNEDDPIIFNTELFPVYKDLIIEIETEKVSEIKEEVSNA